MINIFITVYMIFAFIAIGIIVSKEYRCRQELLRNKKLKEQDNYNRWLHKIGLHETSYYFNPSGIRILNDWLMWNKDVLK